MIILHNNRCSKSRCALNILEENKIKFKVVEYLKETPSEEEIAKLLMKLGLNAIDIVRKKEKIFQEKYRDMDLSNTELIHILHTHPELIERPILINGDKAIIARDELKIKEFIKQ